MSDTISIKGVNGWIFYIELSDIQSQLKEQGYELVKTSHYEIMIESIKQKVGLSNKYFSMEELEIISSILSRESKEVKDENKEERSCKKTLFNCGECDSPICKVPKCPCENWKPKEPKQSPALADELEKLKHTILSIDSWDIQRIKTSHNKLLDLLIADKRKENV